MSAILHLKKKKKFRQDVSLRTPPPSHQQPVLRFPPLKQQPWPTAAMAFSQRRGSFQLSVDCFCLKSLPPAPLSSLREGKPGKRYADIVKLNLIGTVKTARVW